MKINTRKLFGRAALYFAAAYFLTYALYHVSNYVAESVPLYYINITVNRIAYFLLPIVYATVMLTVSAYVGFKRTVISAAPAFLTRMIYYIPYFYIVNYSYGYDSTDAICFAFLLAVAESLIAFGLCVLLLAVMRMLLKKLSRGGELQTLIEEQALSNPPTSIDLSLMIISGAVFAYFTIKEIISAVGFFVEYFDSMKIGEILYMTYLFLLDTAIFFILYFTAARVKNRIISRFKRENDEQTQ